MKLNIKLPVSVNGDPAIVDSAGKIVLPLCWKNDTDHVARQTAIGSYICVLMNADKGKHILV